MSDVGFAVAPSKRSQLVDVRELRSAGRFEVRSREADTIVLEGYASTFEPYEMYGGPAAGGWIEQLATTAFDRTLREKPDLHLLINHEGMPLARTISGNLVLSTDSHGLKVWAELDRSDPDVQRLEPKMRRGDMDEMSFAFRVKMQVWSEATGYDDPMSHRLITEVSLHKGDVSVVNFGANPTTEVELLKKREFGHERSMTAAERAARMRRDEKRRQRSNDAFEASLVTIRDAQRAAPSPATGSVFASMDALDAEIAATDPDTYRCAVLAEQARRDAFDREISDRRWQLGQTAAVSARGAAETLIQEMCREEYARRDAADEVLAAMNRAARR
ncbi:Caudovirus prohead protease [Mycolicibacterium conceptionense]|uniref:Caudovirus prohead protease n=1 Tax=Mycolicibacterium conceptionense TaxID=451644 RepID=A0A0U1DTV4_9MYCO|nr:HK97 family phage prohead protease [Mycolicibacterium conceptionense]ORV29063.1 hypothetical protein AWB98_06645 [Mycolicibacterium conceptionense]CQD21605.1 Caudovirus prohead protease [Mycolicibacterium conceptionense]